MFYDPATNTLVYDDLRSASSLSGATPLFNGYTAIHANLGNLQALRRAGLPIIAPLDRSYDWPGPYKPFRAQRITANFLVTTPRAFVLNDMGTGKTLAALWAADYLMEQARATLGEPFRALIVSPLSTLRSVWVSEIFRTFVGRRLCTVLTGSADKRRKLLAEPADFYIINTDGICIGASSDRRKPMAGLAADLATRTDIKLVVLDEAAAFRDATTRRSRTARTLFSDREYLWLMTGTPTSNGPTDAYGLAKLVNNAYGESFKSYQARVMTQISQFKWVPRTGARAAAQAMLQPAVRFSIADCMDLPPCLVQRRDVELTTAQKEAMHRLKNDFQLAVTNGKIVNAVNAAALRTKLVQIACGAIYDQEHDSHELDADPRMAAVEEIIEQCGEKVIVFAPLTNVLNMLYKRLSKRWSCEVINGGVPQGRRAEIFRAFQAGQSPRILLADPGTMAHGVTLTAASTIVWYAPTDKTELYLQANKRIDRPGQVKATTVVQVASTAVEREIYRRLEANESLQDAILKLGEE